MSAERCKCEICGCEYVYDWLDDDNLNGHLIRHDGHQGRVDMCADCV